MGLLAGPPCETWSRARAVQCSNTHKRAPRVIRIGDDLWGLPQKLELEQICVGNLLPISCVSTCLTFAGTSPRTGPPLRHLRAAPLDALSKDIGLPVPQCPERISTRNEQSSCRQFFHCHFCRSDKSQVVIEAEYLSICKAMSRTPRVPSIA